MDVGTLYEKVCSRFGRAADFWSDAGIARLQGTIRQTRPVGADGAVEFLAARRVDRVIDRGDPFHVGSEPCLTGHIRRDVHTQATRYRDGVDEPAKWCRPTQSEIDPAAEVGGRDRFRRYPFDPPCEGGRVQSGGVDEKTAPDGGRLVAADAKFETVVAYITSEDWVTQHNDRAASLGLALICEHQRVAVDNAGRG